MMRTASAALANGDLSPHRSSITSQFGVNKRAPRLLTEREATIVAFIGSGRSNKAIARELGVAPETVKTHLKRIFQKLSAGTRTQAFARAHGLGLVAAPTNVAPVQLDLGL